MPDSLAAREHAWPVKRVDLWLTTSADSSQSQSRTTTSASTSGNPTATSASGSQSHSQGPAVSSATSNIPSSTPSSAGVATSHSSGTNIEQSGASTSFISTTIVTSIPSTVSSSFTTFTTFMATTVTTSSGVLVSQTAVGNVGSIAAAGQPVCIGDGLDVSAVGLISTLIIPTAIGLIIWLLFAILRPRFRQVYSVREWFPPQELRPRPLRDSLWAFLFPHVPFIPSIPDESELANPGTGAKLPSDGQLTQRVLWVCFLIVLAWSFVGLAGVLPLYLVDTPCLEQSVPQSSFGGLYSTLQDLSLLRLLQLLEDNNISTTNTFVTRAVVNGTDVTSNIKTRLIILTVFVLALGVLPALIKLMREFTKLVNYRRHWLEIHCEGLELAWLSAENAPGFVGWGEKRVKDFIMKIGLSSSLDQSGGLTTSGTMTGIGSGHRARTSSQRDRRRDERTLSNEEKQALEVDIRSLFTIGDTGRLPALIRERDHILEQLEIAEAHYISSFRLTTPDPSVADLPLRLEENTTTKLHISRPKALAGYSTRTRRGRQMPSSSSTAPTSYVAPSQYYKLQSLRGISGGRIYAQSGDASTTEGPSFGDSVRSRIVGTRFQEVSSEHGDMPLPIGSRVTLNQGELEPVAMPAYGPNHGTDLSSGNEADLEASSPGVSKVHDDFEFVDYSAPYDSSAGPDSGAEDSGRMRKAQQRYPVERRETFPRRTQTDETQNEGQVPLHLRLQTQGPFVRPRSGVDHDHLGSVYTSIREWRTRLKQINIDISEEQNNCYNDIADGLRIRGWLITGRGLHFIPNVELIEGRSKDDIIWDELQSRGRPGKKIIFWLLVAMIGILLGAALIAVAGLVVAMAPDVAHYLPFFETFLENDDKWGPGIATTLVPAILATLFFFAAVGSIKYASRSSGDISAVSAQLTTYKATFFILCIVGAMWFTAVGAVLFSIGAFATGSSESSTVANGSIYMTMFFLALVVNVAIIAPGLLLLQPVRFMNVISRERRAATPRQRFRALYPRVYDPTYGTACCILAVILASTFSFIFPLIGLAVVLLLLLTIVAHRFLVGHVYGRTEPQTGGILQIWLLKRFASVVSFQPILLGLIFFSRRLWVQGGILIGFGVAVIFAVELYAYRKTKKPSRKSLSAVTLNSLNRFEERVKNEEQRESEGASLVSASRMRSRGSMASVLEMMSLTLAVMPTPHQARGAVPLETESLDDLVATDRAARTHPDAPPHLPPLPFADHAEEMAGILYAPELIAPSPTIWLPNDAAGIARSEAYDLSRYHGLRTTLDVRSIDDVPNPRRSLSRRRVS